MRARTRSSFALPALLAALAGCDNATGTSDSVAPTVAVVSAGTRYTNTPRVTVTGKLSDDVKVTRATARADGGPEQEITIVPGAEVSFSAEVTFSPSARNAVVVHAYDAAGNRGSSDTVRVEFDDVAPGFDVQAPRAGVFSTGGGDAARQVEVIVVADGPFKHAGLRVNGGSETIVGPSAGCANCVRAWISGLREGLNVLQVAVYDEAGNHTTKTVNFVWSESPRITVNTPRLPATVTTRTVRVTGIATHPLEITRLVHVLSEGTYRDLPGTGTAIPFDFEVPLWAGVNQIEIRAFYASSYAVGATFTVTRDAGPDAGGVFSAVVAGAGSMTCGIGRESALYCWGGIVTAEFQSRLEPAPRAQLGGAGIAFTRLAAGQPTCALATGGAAYCWGANADGQLGDGTRVARERLAPVAGGLRFATIAHQYGTTCAVATDGAGYCWGEGGSGMIGNGGFIDVTTPTAIGGGHRWSDIAVASRRVCGLTNVGALYCWGGSAAIPSALASGLTFTAIAGGGGSMCALDTVGAPFCWGLITQQGVSLSAVPVRVAGGLTLKSLSVGLDHACGLTAAGAAYCWGMNRHGQLGNGATSTSNITTPVAVAGSRVFTSISAGANYSCAVEADGAAFCWGAGSDGQLGTGAITPTLVPRRVDNPI